MAEYEEVDWNKELQTLVSQAKTEKERKSAFAFAAAISPYLDKPEMLRTLLGKIMMSPTDTVAIVAGKKNFASLEDLQKRVGASVSVVRL
jgi:uncharacterized protein YcbX